MILNGQTLYLLCDRCGKKEKIYDFEIPAGSELFKYNHGDLPDGWKQIGDLHFCKTHSVKLVVDNERADHFIRIGFPDE